MPDFTRPDLRSQLMGTTPDGRPGRIFSQYDGDLNVSLSDANGHNIMASIFGDLISGTRVPIFASAFNEGIPVESFRFEWNNTAKLFIEQQDLGNGLVHNNMLVNSTGTSNSSSYVRSRNRLRYMPGHESYAFFTAKFINADAAGTKACIGLCDADNGYTIGFNDGIFSYRRMTAGVEHIVEFTDFNGHFDVSNVDFTKINIFAIKFGYLGVAPIEIYMFDVEDELDSNGKITGMGKFKLLHQEKFTGKHDYPHSINPNLPFSIFVENATTGLNVQVGTASVEMGNVNGHTNLIDPSARTGVFNRLGLATSTNTVVAAFRNADQVSMIDSYDAAGNITYANFKNTVVALLQRIRASSDGAQPVSISIYMVDEAAITNTPTWEKDDFYFSVVEYANDATVDLTNAKLLTAIQMGKVDRVSEEVRIDNFLLFPGQYSVIVANGNNTINFSNSWEEQF